MLVSQWGRVRRQTVNKLWWVVSLTLLAVMTEVMTLSGPNICIVKQKYNITKRVKYRAPVSVRTYEWCLAVPPRCSRYSTEMRDLTRLETEERTAEIAVCCPGYKMRGDFTCGPICPFGKTGAGCTADCPPNKWGPNCVHTCKNCTDHGKCSPITGECVCHTGWQGESCERSMPTTTTTAATTMRASLLTTSIAELTTSPTETSLPPTAPAQTQTTIDASKVTTNQAVTQNIRIQDSKTVNAENSSIKIPNIKPRENVTRDVKTMYTEESSTRKFSQIDLLDRNITTDIVNKKQKSVKKEETTIKDSVISELNKTSSTIQILRKLEENTQITVYDNTTIMPWTVAMTKGTVKTIPITMTTVASTKLHTTEAVISTKMETPKKILPFTIAETTTKSTSKEIEITMKPELTKMIPTTAKFKPKEIWIKPAQKGEMPIIEMKAKSHEVFLFKAKHSSDKALPTTTTTPRTMIVSIIPTSVSYSTFKKISLTTAPHTQQYKTSQSMEQSYGENTKTPTPYTIKNNNFIASKKQHFTTTTEVSTSKLSIIHGSKAPPMLAKTTKYLYSEATNSMSMTNEVNKLNYPPFVPITPSTRKGISGTISSRTMTASPSLKDDSSPMKTSTMKTEITSNTFTTSKPQVEREKSANVADKTQNKIININPLLQKNVTSSSFKEKTNTSTEAPKKLTTPHVTEDTSTNTVTNAETKQDEEETFHILTEPEHITAVAGNRPPEISTVDLIYVLTIVGGMVMGIITIAVVIVMFERCKRHRYGDLMKMNNIRMQVVIDNNERPPPPYVRSIFHTPLPDPPTSDKCHYQPISTLDRNLKQFMRPVVVQAISPLMLENFRGILECHYDHLPRRSHDFRASECGRMCCSITPSVDVSIEPHSSRGNSVTDSTIEALKCEADVDEIEASEPLYAEIPCWRPPSAHAVEVVNVNGEAMTEL